MVTDRGPFLSLPRWKSHPLQTHSVRSEGVRIIKEFETPVSRRVGRKHPFPILNPYIIQTLGVHGHTSYIKYKSMKGRRRGRLKGKVVKIIIIR